MIGGGLRALPPVYALHAVCRSISSILRNGTGKTSTQGPLLLPGLPRPPALQRLDPDLEFLVLRLHPPERPADPLHVPVRLIHEFPGGLLFGHPGNPPGEQYNVEEKSLTVTIMYEISAKNACPAVVGREILPPVQEPSHLSGGSAGLFPHPVSSTSPAARGRQQSLPVWTSFICARTHSLFYL